MKPPEKRRDADYLQDMMTHAEMAITFVAGMDFSTFEKDLKTVHAATHCIQIVGEASIHLTQQIKDSLPAIQWHQIRGMRNLLVHAYHNADSEIIFVTIRDRLPNLIHTIRTYLERS